MGRARQPNGAQAIERIFEAWDAALGAKGLDASMARESLGAFVEKVFAQEPPERRRFRMGFLSDGSRVTWEYPREAGAGEQMDVVEVMEIRDGLIQHHRVYWGGIACACTRRSNPRGP